MNRARADISQKLCEGDTLQLFLPDDLLSDNGESKAEPYRTITPHIDIIYEDEEIILIDKKPGMAVHGGDDSTGGGSRIDERDTLINNVLAYLWREGEYDPDTERSFTPALCNRIDRNTGGIVIAAKDRRGAAPYKRRDPCRRGYKALSVCSSRLYGKKARTTYRLDGKGRTARHSACSLRRAKNSERTHDDNRLPSARRRESCRCLR